MENIGSALFSKTFHPGSRTSLRSDEGRPKKEVLPRPGENSSSRKFKLMSEYPGDTLQDISIPTRKKIGARNGRVGDG